MAITKQPMNRLTLGRKGRTGTRVTVVLVTFFALTATAGGGGTATAATKNSFGLTCVSRPTPISTDSTLGHVTGVKHGRLVTYTMTSPAVGLTHVNVLLPVGYNPESSKRYPVLYLLHGSGGSYANWASTATSDGIAIGGDVERIVGRLPLIVVMPDDSGDGSYADWYGISSADAAMKPPPRTPAWENYHIDELIPWVDSTFHAQGSAAGRAIAGLSSGGAGAAKYATSNPGLFGYVGTFSGAVDTDLVDSSLNWYTLSDAISSDGPPNARCAFGDPYTTDPDNQAYYWHSNDPTYEAGNLAGVKLFVASGNGSPTAADANTNPTILAAQEETERIVDDMSHHFVAAVRRDGLGADLTTDFYGAGVHAWYYWQRDLKDFLEWLSPQLGRGGAAPSSFSFTTADAVSAAWGWTFRYATGLSIANVNTAEEFVYLSHVSANGFDAAGNGTLAVMTPKGSYRPDSLHEVAVGGVSRRIGANRAGQLRFSVRIGPPAVHSQDEFPTVGPPPSMPRVNVTISAVAQSAHSRSTSWTLPLATAGAALVALCAVAFWRRGRRRRLGS
jgi:S-formylglutathione hydrolase FrmB